MSTFRSMLSVTLRPYRPRNPSPAKGYLKKSTRVRHITDPILINWFLFAMWKGTNQSIKKNDDKLRKTKVYLPSKGTEIEWLIFLKNNLHIQNKYINRVQKCIKWSILEAGTQGMRTSAVARSRFISTSTDSLDSHPKAECPSLLSVRTDTYLTCPGMPGELSLVV